MFYFFFFQAEDGIRDIGVTGVQTCALPIYLHLAAGRAAEALAAFRPIGHPAVLAASLVDRVDAAVRVGEVGLARSWLASALPKIDVGRLTAGPAHACALLDDDPEAGLDLTSTSL